MQEDLNEVLNSKSAETTVTLLIYPLELSIYPKFLAVIF